MLTIKQLSYRGWHDCYIISNGIIEAVAVADIGPRIIHCAFGNGPNLFAEIPDQIGRTGGEIWRNYGGHRLWHSPESKTRTYFPDNFPVKIQKLSAGLLLQQPVETNTGIEKTIKISIVQDQTFMVDHFLANRGCWPVELAPWAITMMAPGGTAIIPHYREPEGDGLTPNRVMALWPYTEMNDSRAAWGKNYFLFRQDPSKKNAFKVGLTVPQGWMAYLNKGVLFMKKHTFQKPANYPDGGVNVELYADSSFLELESLGPLATLNPGETVALTEYWSLEQNVGPIGAEAEVDSNLARFLNRTI